MKFIKKIYDKNPFLFVGLVTAFVIRVLASFFSVGYLHPDAHFQYIEPAFFKAYGFGALPWEYTAGETVRSWFIPSIIQLHLWILKTLGIHDALVQIFTLRLWLCILSVIGVYYAYRLTQYLSDETAARMVLVFCATWGFLVYFNIQLHGEMMAFAFTLMAHVFCLRAFQIPNQYLWHGFLSGFWFGCAFVIKFQVAPLAFALGLFMIIQKNIRVLAGFGLGFLLIFFAQGLFDWMVYHKFLASFLRYGHLMLFTEHASSGGWGSQDPLSYFSFLTKILSPLVFPWLLFFFFYGLKRMHIASASFIFYFLVHSVLAHKEIRYAAPMVPFLIISGCVAFRQWQIEGKFLKKYTPQLSKVIFGCFIIGNFLQYAAPFVPWFLKPTRPAWLRNAAICKASHYVGKQKDSTGALYVQHDMPGMFYIHKNIPLVQAGNNITTVQKSLLDPTKKINYIIFNNPHTSQAREIKNYISQIPNRTMILKKSFASIDKTSGFIDVYKFP